MKKIIFYIFWAFFTLSLTSCEDLLREDQKGVYSEDTFYDSEENAISALLYAYRIQTRTEYAQRFQFYLFDCASDQWSTYGIHAESRFYKWDISPLSEEFQYFYKHLYIMINRANSVLKNVAKMPESIISTKSKNQILGEAYFIRAYNHFMAVRTFGEVPLHLKMIEDPAQGHVKFSSIPDIYESIISDLETAIELTSYQKLQGRADKATAEAVLAKVYLTLASSKDTGAPGYEWVESADEMYKKSEEVARHLCFEQNVYSLEPDLWKVYNVDYEDSPEHLWISHHTDMYNQINFPMMFANSIKDKYINKHEGSPVEKASDVEAFIGPGQQGWSNFRLDPDFYESYDPKDIRRELHATTLYDKNGKVIAEWHRDNVNSSDPMEKAFYYPMCVKYSDRHAKDINTSAELYFERFAEALLTYAEAAGPTEKGYEAINMVRHRAGLDPLESGLSVKAFREKVWQELEWELASEGKALLEYRRTNRVIEKVGRLDEVIKDRLNEYAYFYPIPQRETDLNPQN